jgi:ABC-type uncharacterized transport system involved in gliding motility auxiliary subunit
LPDEARNTLSAYLKSGGKWLLLVKPWQTAGLDPLLQEWGLEVRPVFLSDPESLVAGLGPTTVVTRYMQRHPVTESLAGSAVVFPYATSVRNIKTERLVDGINLILTSPKGFGIAERDAQQLQYDEAKGDIKGPVSIAAAIEEPVNLYSADGRKEPARIVAVGNADFATNRHIQRLGNSDFFLNAVDWLAKRESLIAIRGWSANEKVIALSAKEQSLLYWLSLGAVPGLVGLIGGAVAWRRRR